MGPEWVPITFHASFRLSLTCTARPISSINDVKEQIGGALARPWRPDSGSSDPRPTAIIVGVELIEIVNE